jgi:thymidine kinase
MYINDDGITIIVGSMFSEKSGELISRLNKAEVYGGKRVITFKPILDNRFGSSVIKSRTGLQRTAINLETDINEMNYSLVIAMANEYDVVGIDEVQFFGGKIVELIKELARQGKQVIVAGLNMDYEGEPFGKIGEILAIAHYRDTMYAICSCCKKRYAVYTQRLVNGEPAKKKGQKILIGDKEDYEARCHACFVPPTE